MQTIVCVRQALDWSTSTRDFRIDPVTHEVAVTFARHRIDQYDEIALQVALNHRAANGGVTVRAFSAGADEDVLRHALSMKADLATHVVCDAAAGWAAGILAAAIARHDDAGIVLCGRTSSDHGIGETGPALAELLRRPFVANVIAIEGDAGDWRCTVETPAGYQQVRVTAPFVATVTNAATNVPRKPAMKDTMLAHRMPIEQIAGAQLADAAAAGCSGLSVARRFVPMTARECVRLTGDADEQARALAARVIAAMPQEH